MLHDALIEWIGGDEHPESLRNAMGHLSGAWARRGEPNVLLVHYDDLLADLEGQMRWLASRLGITVPEQSWPVLAEAATFERMRDREDILIPPPPGIVADNSAFFRRGTSGSAREILSDDQMTGYYARAAGLAPADLIEWLHRPGHGTLNGPGPGRPGGGGP
jgi:aryl sulfotransferase